MNKFLVSALVVSLGFAQYAHAAAPKWYAKFLHFFTQDDGCWQASNVEYQSEEEPFSAYRVVWSPTIGERGKQAVLTGLTDGRESAPFWQIRVYFDGALAQVRVLQQGNHGVVGKGFLEEISNTAFNQELEFSLPDGRTWGDKHEIVLEGQQHKTTSFTKVGENWKQNRVYLWSRCG